MAKNRMLITAGFVGLLAFAGRANATTERAVDPAADRIVYGPTALPNGGHKVKFSSFNLGLWQVDYAATSRLNLGVQAVPPFGVFVLGGMARTSFSIAPNVHLGAYANAGTLGTFFRHSNVLYYGGGPMLTVGNSQRALNVSVLTYGASYKNHHRLAMLPSVGGSVQVSSRVKLNLEGYLVTTPKSSSVVRAGAILYGFRIFSETGSVFGDVNFLAPIANNVGKFYRYFPMGIPVLAFGFSI